MVDLKISCACPQCRAVFGSADFAAAGDAAAPVDAAGTYYIDALLAGGGAYAWNSVVGTAASVSYSFLETLPAVYAGEDESDNFIAFNDAQKTAARNILGLWAEVCNLTFTETTGALGQIRFGTAELPVSVGGWAYYPGSGTGGDVWVTNYYQQYLTPDSGSYAFSLFVHEIGHALGLKHPGNYNAGGGGAEGPYLPSAEDSAQYTVMSYNDHPTTSVVDPMSPLLYDIAAVQYLYGANTTTRSGDSTYSWGVGESFLKTLWDAGGTDTIDASNQTANQTIDLRAGYFSSIAGQRDNLAVAYGVVLENAVGGSGADTLISNSAANILTGGAGVDTYVFSGTWGADTVRDSGTNTIVIDAASTAITLRRSGRNLQIIKSGTSDSVTVENAYDDESGVATQAWTITATDGNLAFAAAATNRGPTATATAGSLTAGTAAAVSGYFSVSDPEGDSVTLYQFWDSGAADAGAYIAVSGVRQNANQTIEVAANALSTVTVVGGAANTTDQLWVRAYDGTTWGAWADWTLTTTGGNTAPTVSAGDRSAAVNLSTAASGMFSMSDANGDTITAYEFWDSNDAAGSGYFTVNGAGQEANRTISVSAAQLSSTYVVAGGAPTVDRLWVRGYDGVSWSEWASWNLTTVANTAPTATPVGSSQSATSGQSTALSGLFTTADSDGHSITAYEFWDSGDGSGSGYVSVDGAAQGANQTISVSAAQLSSAVFVGGAANGSETLWVRAYDGVDWSAWTSWSMTTSGGNTPPTVSASSASVHLNTQTAVSTLFSVSDANSDTPTQYEFWDSGAAEGGGYFTVGGAAQNPNTTISISAAQLSSTYFVAGSRAVADLVWARAYDGLSWSDWKSWTLTTTGAAPTVSPTAGVQTAASGQSTVISGLFSAIDPDGQNITQYELWDSGADEGTGYFSVSGAAQGANRTISVSAAQASSTVYVGGAADGSETVWARAYDGGVWSDWSSWTMTSTGGNARPTVSASAQTVAAGAAVAVSSLFSTADPTGDVITRYELWDSGDAAGSGYFTVSGAVQTANRLISITAGQFAAATFTGGASAGSEQIWARAFDGTGWSDWTAMTATTAAGAPAAGESLLRPSSEPLRWLTAA